MELKIAKAVPASGPGWRGGSIVGPADRELFASGVILAGYELLKQSVEPITLAEILSQVAIDEMCAAGLPL